MREWYLFVLWRIGLESALTAAVVCGARFVAASLAMYPEVFSGAVCCSFFFFQAEDGIRDSSVTGVQTCALPISHEVLAVGDLHVENFGTWRDAEGRLTWGVNDFDEAYPLPYTIDLARLATSVRSEERV